MIQHELKYLLALQKVQGMGLMTKKVLLQEFGSARRVFEEINSMRLSTYTKRKVMNNIRSFNNWKAIEDDLRKLEKLKAEVLTADSPAYPSLLQECPDSPLVLFVKGRLPQPTDIGIGIVGTRTPSEYGILSTHQLLNHCENHPVFILSGLATGIDATAHRHALSLKIPTIGILAHGFQYMYPAQHRGLANMILEQGGALVSEYLPSTKIEKHHFAARNRIIAGWSKLLVVVESGEKGGSLRTAAFAAQYNRDVLAVPGRWIDHKSMGANQLIVNHQADILFHPKQILDYLPQLSQSEAIPSVHLSNLSEKEQEIIDLFNQRQLLHFDEMLNSIQISVADLTHRLLLLEMSNHIECLPGKYYRLNRNILVHFSGER